MPHVIVKLVPGRSEQQKADLAAAITQAVITIAGSKEPDVSVAIEEVPLADWTERVYRPDIEPQLGRLYKTPGYGPA